MKTMAGEILPWFVIFADFDFDVYSPRFTSGATLADVLAAGLRIRSLISKCMCRGGTMAQSRTEPKVSSVRTEHFYTFIHHKCA